MQYQNQIPTQNIQPNTAVIPPIAQILEPQTSNIIEPTPLNDIPTSIKILNAWLIFLMIINLGFGILKILGLITIVILALISKTALRPLQILLPIVDISLLLILFVLIRKYRKYLKLLEHEAFIALAIFFIYYILYSTIDIFNKVVAGNILDFLLNAFFVPVSLLMLILLLLARQYFINKTELKIVRSIIIYSLISLAFVSFQVFLGFYLNFKATEDFQKTAISVLDPNAPQTEITEWETYTNKEYNMQFDIPKGWRVSTTFGKDGNYMFYIQKGFMEQLGLIDIYPASPNVDYLTTTAGEIREVGGQKAIYGAEGKFTVPYKGRLYVISLKRKILDDKTVEIPENSQRVLDSFKFI